MSSEMTNQNQGLTQITKENWASVWQEIKVSASLHPAEIISLNTPQLSTINYGTGSTENGITLIEAIIVSLLDFYGLEWSAFQIRDTAELWHQEYYWLHIAELKHFITRCKSGKFGKLYGKFSPSVLMSWLDEYATESIEVRSSNFIRQSDQLKYDEEKGTRKERERDDQKEELYYDQKLKAYTEAKIIEYTEKIKNNESRE
jgi:hypothetical protein